MASKLGMGSGDPRSTSTSGCHQEGTSTGSSGSDSGVGGAEDGAIVANIDRFRRFFIFFTKAGMLYIRIS